MSALHLEHLIKSFEKPDKTTFRAVDDVSLTIPEGTIHGLLGPNGAGKSTLISMISGMAFPDSGSIELFSTSMLKQPVVAKQLLGVVPQEVVVEAAFTVYEVLYYFSGMYGVPVSERGPRIKEVLEDLGLTDQMHVKARGLSGGMKRRLMIAKAIMHRPKFLILDEPTAGVDVALRQKIWDLVRRLHKQGTTILFTTHYLEEAEQLCESITLINHGKIIKEGKLRDIQAEFSKKVIHFELFDPSAPLLEGVRRVGSEFEYPMEDLERDLTRVVQHYHGNVKSIRNEHASLEQIFLELTSK